MSKLPEDDDTVNYQSGKISGIFSIGTRVEALQESYANEINTFESMKAGIALAATGLIDYKNAMIREMTESKLPIRDVEFGKTYVNRCIEIVQKLFNDTEAKRLQAIGAADAMKKMVESAKRLYDEENDKLGRFTNFSNSDKDPKERPLGYQPPSQSKKKVKNNKQHT